MHITTDVQRSDEGRNMEGERDLVLLTMQRGSDKWDIFARGAYNFVRTTQIHILHNSPVVQVFSSDPSNIPAGHLQM